MGIGMSPEKLKVSEIIPAFLLWGMFILILIFGVIGSWKSALQETSLVPLKWRVLTYGPPTLILIYIFFFFYTLYF